MIIFKNEGKDSKKSSSCHICGKEYTKENVPVKGHFHMAGK